MDSKQHAAAGNALVEWCNSQEIAPADALSVMSKVIAKLLVQRAGTKHRGPLHNEIDKFTLQLVHDVNDRLFDVR